MSTPANSGNSNALRSADQFLRSNSYKPPHARRTSNRTVQSNKKTEIIFDKEAAERRKQRFANDKKKQDDNYGLISRGEDNRLQRDPQARINFFKKIQQDVSN